MELPDHPGLLRFETLAPGDSCLIIAVFEPQEEGDLTANLLIDSNAAGPQPSVALSGKALPRLLPKAELSLTSHDFGTQGLATETTKTFELTDSGQGDLDMERRD